MKEPATKKYLLSDIGKGELFEDHYGGQVKYCYSQDVWFIWDGCRWCEDTTGRIHELAKDLVAIEMPKVAATIKGDTERMRWLEWARKSQSNHARREMLASAKTRPAIAAEIKEFDYNHQLVNMRNGILDIHHNKLLPHEKFFLLTKMAGANYDPQAHCARWDAFILEIMNNDADAARFLQKAVGYALSGNPSEDCLFILFGEKTRNGKTTFCRAILNALGDYGSSARPESLAINRSRTGSAPNSDIARLRGARFVNMPEPGKGMELDGALVKTLTGRDPILARFMHKEFFEFIPQFVLFMNTNYLPRIDDLTLFSSGRIFCIPFPVHFDAGKQDVNLLEQFCTPEAASAVFNWIYEGYRLYKQEGLKTNIPDVVQAATNQYSADSDNIGRFLKDNLSEYKNNYIEAMRIYQIYEQWAQDNGHRAMSSKNLFAEMRQRGYASKLHSTTRRMIFVDIVLNCENSEG